MENLFGVSSVSGAEAKKLKMSNGAVGGGSNGGGAHVATGAASVADSDYAADPASSTFFASDLKKHGDLKNMLESNKDQLRLEAMKRIIGMVAKGKDAHELFPSVVKNVVSKNIEIKKLVYAYLVRYAEEQQDLALLSISTFQRALKDPNQLIRANALRVLSSIRVPVIVPIMMLAIKDSTSDMSPYVRKTAALAIPKLFSLDDEQKDQLIEVIEKLLSDKTTLVVGSTVMAFEEVCPERIDLIHKNYRRLCLLLVDLEEWGQVAVLNMLTRYARTQFVNPNQQHEAQEDGGSDHEEFYDDENQGSKSRIRRIAMDTDHRLLLKCAKPLLQSRNSAVVMAVVQLYHHIGPKVEMVSTIKPLIRLLRSHREIQSVVLSNIATLANKPDRKQLLVPHLKTFFVRSSDPTFIKLQKLEILTSLASESTIAIILREFQAYIASSDRELVASTIQAIGRCAITITEVTETCLNGLVNLLSNRDDNVVAESVCVIRKLLQLQPNAHKEIINHLAKLVEKITVPMAKASIYWLIGEYCEQVPTIGPDVLRIAAKTFSKEENIVKLQIINLASKLYTVNPAQVSLLVMYVFNLGKYDVNYDIRDRTRFLRAVILPTNLGSGDDGVLDNTLNKHARQILLAAKPAPLMESRFKDRAEFQLGTLSHFLNLRANGYQDLPDFPTVPPPSETREVAVPVVEVKTRSQGNQMSSKSAKPSKAQPPKKAKKFYSDEESSEGEESEDEEDDEESDEESDEETSDEESEGEENDNGAGDKSVTKKKVEKLVENSEESSSEEESDESSSSGEESDEKEKPPKEVPKKQISLATISPDDSKPKPAPKTEKPAPKTVKKEEKVPSPSEEAKTKTAAKAGVKEKPKPVDNLLDLDDFLSTPGPSVIPFAATLMPTGTQPVAAIPKSSSGNIILPPLVVSNKPIELLSPITSGGLGIAYRFPRRPFVYSEKMVAVELSFVNSSDSAVFTDIKIVRKKLPNRVTVHDFHEISTLEPRRTLHGTVGIDFCDSVQNIGLTIGCGEKEYDVTLKTGVGEMLLPIQMDRARFDSNKASLSGLNENYANIDLSDKLQSRAAVNNLLLETANMAPVTAGDSTDAGGYSLRYASQTVSSGSAVLVSVVVTATKALLTVNCEKVLVGSMVLKELKDALVKTGAK